MTDTQIERMVRGVIDELKRQNLVEFLSPEDACLRKGIELIKREYQDERDLEIEAQKMVDDLERKSPGGFERHKMYLMIKKELAKKKKVVL